MKSLLKLILVFSLLVGIQSCSKDEDQTDIEQPINIEFNDSNNSRAPEFDYYSGTEKVIDYLKNHPEIKLPLKQNDFDTLLGVSGYDGTIDEAMGNQMIDLITEGHDIGAEAFLNKYHKGTEYTRSTLLSIYENGPIKNIERDPEYLRLPADEQRYLSQVNSMAANYLYHFSKNNQRNSGCSLWGQPSSCAISYGFHGAFIGAVAGYSSCGFICGAAGGIIGGAVGLIVGGIVDLFSK